MPKHIESSSIIPLPMPTNKQFMDMTGQRIFRLVVLSFAGRKFYKNGTGQSFWFCLCDCGKKTIANGASLRNGDTKSCGCYSAGLFGAFSTKHLTKHGMCDSGAYRSWSCMWNRCRNPNADQWSCYGGRGIRVCKRWEKFEDFFVDMGHRPSTKHTIERRNHNGDYSPENCYWATPKQQARNRRNNHLVTFNGETMCLIEWAEKLGISKYAIRNRLRAGWTVERTFTQKVRRQSC